MPSKTFVDISTNWQGLDKRLDGYGVFACTLSSPVVLLISLSNLACHPLCPPSLQRW